MDPDPTQDDIDCDRLESENNELELIIMTLEEEKRIFERNVGNLRKERGKRKPEKGAHRRAKPANLSESVPELQRILKEKEDMVERLDSLCKSLHEQIEEQIVNFSLKESKEGFETERLITTHGNAGDGSVLDDNRKYFVKTQSQGLSSKVFDGSEFVSRMFNDIDKALFRNVHSSY